MKILHTSRHTAMFRGVQGWRSQMFASFAEESERYQFKKTWIKLNPCRMACPAHGCHVGPCCCGFSSHPWRCSRVRQTRRGQIGQVSEANVVVCFGENLFIPRSEGRFNIQPGAATPHLCISCLVWNAATSGMSCCNYFKAHRTSTTFGRKEGGILCSIARQNRNQQLGFFSKSRSIFSAIKSELDGSLVPILLSRCECVVLQLRARVHGKI